MRLAFSTLGVPGLPIPDVIRLAATHGYHGVELRAHPEEPVHPGIDLAGRADVAAEFKAAGIEVLGLAGYARVAAPGDDGPVIDEIRGLLDLARDLGAPYIRVFPGGGHEQSTERADATAARRLGTAAEFPFTRLIRALAPLLAPGGDLERATGRPVDVLWQTGCTPVDGLPVDARRDDVGR